MAGAHGMLNDLAVVLSVAAVTTVVFHRLRLPVVVGYLLAGLIVGPSLPLGLVESPASVEALAELGVVLLMFSIGLGFSVGELGRVGPTAGIVAAVELSLMAWLGYLAGRMLGWTSLQSVFAGGVVAISSTTIIFKVFEEQRILGRLRELVLGIVVVEDLAAVLLLGVLEALARGAGADPGAILGQGARLVGFLATFLVLGLLVVPRVMRFVTRLERAETTVVTSLGIAFAAALTARGFGYSLALGAFAGGAIIAESGLGAKVETLLRPVRDMFAAVFFVSIGMLVDPALVVEHWPLVALFSALVVVGKVGGVGGGAFLVGSGVRTSMQAGMSMAQIGEFAFVIAAAGRGVVPLELFSATVAVSALTILGTPFLVRASGPAASLVEHKLPGPIQTFASLYGSWIERLQAASPRRTTGARVRRLLGLIATDALFLALVAIGAGLATQELVAFLRDRLGAPPLIARVVVASAALALALPAILALVRLSHRLAVVLARAALPRRPGVDLAAEPRRALVLALHLGTLTAVGIPLVALTEPFLPRFSVFAVLLLVLGITGLRIWRSADALQGHVRAGAQVVAEALLKQARGEGPSPASGPPADLEAVEQLLPGMGELVPVRLEPRSLAAGRTLAEVNLRGLTGATVMAIRRGGNAVVLPTAGERLEAGDVLALAGSEPAILAARELLRRTAPAGAGAP